MLNDRVNSRIQDGLVTTVTPANYIGWFTIRSTHLQDLTVTFGVPTMAASNHDAITDTGLHLVLPSFPTIP